MSSTESTIKARELNSNSLRNLAHDHEIFSTSTSDESPSPLSATVTNLASNVYKELERIIRNFGENSVKDLMPVMISILESLDSALHDRDEVKLQNESLKEQNDQLLQQYEREKGFHKDYQQRYSQIEDQFEELKRNHEEKLLSLESLVKIFEIKSRSATDHITRLEEKENEMKSEYKRLHDRYNELFKSHCDYMERMKILHGSENLNSSKNQSDEETPTKFSMLSNDAAVNTAKLGQMSLGDDVSLKDFLPDQNESDDENSTEDGKNRNEQTEVDAPEDLFVRQSFYGMTKEVSNLIKENNELLETKNALNVLKDDLLSKIEELNNEQEILREEVESLQTVKQRLQTKISEVEDELKKTREELEKKIKEEEDVPTADRKRFTRIEMQRVLLERNQYKQRLFELEEALHRQDALRASRHEQIYGSANSMNHSHPPHFDQNRTVVWNFFSGLFGSGMKDAPTNRSATHNRSPLSSDQQAPNVTQSVSISSNIDSASSFH